MMPRDEGELTMMNDNDSEPTRLCHDEGEPGWSVMRTTLAKFKITINLTDVNRWGGGREGQWLRQVRRQGAMGKWQEKGGV